MSAERPRVLLVDDRHENLLALEAVLAPLDCELLRAGSGEEALKVLLQHDVAAILLDVQMPGMDGFETARLVRGRERSRRTPIIFLTAISKDLEHVVEGYEAGAVDYVVKPFDPFVLRSKVAVFCDLEHERAARRRAVDLLQAAWDSSPTGVCLVDERRHVIRANPALERLTGRGGTDLVGDVCEIVAGDGRSALRDLLAGVDPGGTPTGELEVELRGLTGERIPVSIVAAAVRDEDHPVRRILLQFDDLRERRHAQRAQQRLVAEQAARAEAEAQARRLAAVAEITDGLDDLALATIVPTLCERLRTVLGAQGAVVAVLGDDERVAIEVSDGMRVDSALLERAQERTSTLHREGPAQAVALRVEGRLLGVVGVTGASVEAEREGLLRLAADRAALILERGRLYDRERRIAATLQQDLLPDRLPDVPGLALAAYLRSGADGMQVGGDWYDALLLPGGRLGLVVGDVAGRGVAAAARMGEVRSVARAYALEGHPPAEVARRLNAYHLAMGADTMTTLLYVVLEPDLARLRVVSAGHVPPLLRAPGRDAEYLDTKTGPPLGVLDVCRYEEQIVAFEPGSLLVLYTDGLVERRGEPLDDGLERLRRATGDAPSEDPESARAAIVGACLDGAVADDVTALVVRAQESLGSPARFVLSPDRESLMALRRALRRWLAEEGATEEESAAIVMAANEAWQNAIEHGHGFAMAPINVAFDHVGSEVVVTVRDLGHASGRTPDPDRGRGIELMRALVDEAQVDVGLAAGGTVTLRHGLARDVARVRAMPCASSSPAPRATSARPSSRL